MEYRGIEYSVVQGIGRNLWIWSASVANVVITGQSQSKSEAMVEAEKAIDRALAPKKVRLVPLGTSNGCSIRRGKTSTGDAASWRGIDDGHSAQAVWRQRDDGRLPVRVLRRVG
jgi:hypothetical protein